MVTVTGTCFFHILGIIAMLVYQRVHPMDILHTICLVGGLEHEWIIFPFSWEWNNHPNWRTQPPTGYSEWFPIFVFPCVSILSMMESPKSMTHMTRWLVEPARWRDGVVSQPDPWVSWCPMDKVYWNQTETSIGHHETAHVIIFDRFW